MFTNKVAIVTGASSGIGRATALGLVKSGASIVAVGRGRRELESVLAEAGHAGGPSIAIVADVTETDAPDEIVRQTVERFGGIDVVVNAAGILQLGTTDATSDELWDRMMGINLGAPFRLMRAAFRISRSGAERSSMSRASMAVASFRIWRRTTRARARWII